MKTILLNLLLKVIVGALASFVKRTVTILDGTDIANEDKRRKAFNEITDEAKTTGKSLGTSVINLAIEIGVNLLRGKDAVRIR
jgi:hypothetical protein